MDITSYLLGKNASGGGGSSSTILTGKEKFAYSNFGEFPEWLLNATGWENYTDMSYIFSNCSVLITIPLIDTSNVTTMQASFYNSQNIESIPTLNTSKVTNFNSMFYSCNRLNNESLDNILQMCINATSYTGTKTLKTLGIDNALFYPTSRLQSLPHYQNFINAGWVLK